MNRREALKRVAVMMGGAISLPVIHAVLSGCEFKEPWKPQTLSPEQDKIVTVLAEMIIPETDTPGAKTVHVNRFIDLIVTEWYDAEDRTRFLDGFTGLETRSQQRFGKRFLDLSGQERHNLVTELDQEGVAARLAGEKNLPFFARVKELTLVGYFTSEAGAKATLTYKPIPGHYNGCLPVDEVGRAWM